jgi:hypothetical protein
MTLPSGKIVARPMVVRACGCEQEFQHYEVDRFRAERLAKFKATRCSACVAKLNESQKQAATTLPAKGEALQALPLGTQITLTRKPDGTWAGKLAADGTAVEAAGDWPHGLTVMLARLWLAARSPAAGADPKPG